MLYCAERYLLPSQSEHAKAKQAQFLLQVVLSRFRKPTLSIIALLFRRSQTQNSLTRSGGRDPSPRRNAPNCSSDSADLKRFYWFYQFLPVLPVLTSFKPVLPVANLSMIYLLLTEMS